MKIGITGTSSVGKSTLAIRLAEVTGLPLISDVEVHARAFNMMELRGIAPHTRYFPDMTPEEHVEFERCLLPVRQQLQDENPHFVADETPLDFINWYYVICGQHPDLMPHEEFHKYHEKWVDQIKAYDLIWYLPFGSLPIVDDNRRFTNRVQLEFWDNAIRGLILKLSDELTGRIHIMPYNVIGLEHRVNKVLGSMMGVYKEFGFRSTPESWTF
jgi:AAA domain